MENLRASQLCHRGMLAGFVREYYNCLALKGFDIVISDPKFSNSQSISGLLAPTTNHRLRISLVFVPVHQAYDHVVEWQPRYEKVILPPNVFSNFMAVLKSRYYRALERVHESGF